jgi:hypothetical protein
MVLTVLIVEFFGVGAVHAARSDDEGASPIFGTRAHRDRKQVSEQLLISLLVRTALEPATRPLQAFSMPSSQRRTECSNPSRSAIDLGSLLSSPVDQPENPQRTGNLLAE